MERKWNDFLRRKKKKQGPGQGTVEGSARRGWRECLADWCEELKTRSKGPAPSVDGGSVVMVGSGWRRGRGREGRDWGCGMAEVWMDVGFCATRTREIKKNGIEEERRGDKEETRRGDKRGENWRGFCVMWCSGRYRAAEQRRGERCSAVTSVTSVKNHPGTPRYARYARYAAVVAVSQPTLQWPQWMSQCCAGPYCR